MIGRDTQGVRIIKLNEGQSVASIVVVPRVEDEEEEYLEEVIEDNSDALSAIRTLDEIEEESEEEDFVEEESEE